jgi:hypothetical protein|tara:strand:- start:1890 stop:2327 length:438 start_codon:yes stop_codon:yes gene_type:complete
MNNSIILTFGLFFIVSILKDYSKSILFLRPIILLLGLISEMIFDSNKCKNEKTPVSQITNKALILMSIFLYTEYTVKCIPMVKLTIDSLFQFKKVGEIIKMVVGFMFMLLSSMLFKDICLIKSDPGNIYLSTIIFIIVILNSYLV